MKALIKMWRDDGTTDAFLLAVVVSILLLGTVNLYATRVNATFDRISAAFQVTESRPAK